MVDVNKADAIDLDHAYSVQNVMLSYSFFLVASPSQQYAIKHFPDAVRLHTLRRIESRTCCYLLHRFFPDALNSSNFTEAPPPNR